MTHVSQCFVDLTLALGIVQPGFPTAVETVNPKMPSTLNAVSLSNMAGRSALAPAAVIAAEAAE